VDPQGSASETDRDLTKTPKPVHHPNMEFLSLFKG
jgi:hypothetical protein